MPVVPDPRSDLRIEKLARQHDVDWFDCGVEPLNRFLHLHALANGKAGASQTWVAIARGEGEGEREKAAEDRIVGYHTLVVGEVRHADAPERLGKGLPRHPIPIMVLARLAIDRDWQGRGLGSGLLKDALIRTLAAADIAGIRAMVVHAKDEDARRFYERFDFVPFPSDPLHLGLLLKDARRRLKC